MNIAPIFLFFQLGACLRMKFGKIEMVDRLKNQKQKAHENATPLRPLSCLIFVCIMYCNEYSVIG